jgi:hypothetical protein
LKPYFHGTTNGVGAALVLRAGVINAGRHVWSLDASSSRRRPSAWKSIVTAHAGHDVSSRPFQASWVAPDCTHAFPVNPWFEQPRNDHGPCFTTQRKRYGRFLHCHVRSEIRAA